MEKINLQVCEITPIGNNNKTNNIKVDNTVKRKNIKRKRKRCQHESCNNWLKLTSTKCKCEKTYCSGKCRSSHNCTYDYRKEFEKRHKNDNPRVVVDIMLNRI